ncbi:hypothetical protein RJ640_029270 [Escallonia rubra]|uniref:Reverse transcriptase Ty1/copia-type domain-containing protein n=1 Tax=Escallonia rubra TaxID=112253 RepID=A0AA88QSU4_9ASTE|nr:hypothetical protein RJ640_029270 [Escallonia rubra]
MLLLSSLKWLRSSTVDPVVFVSIFLRMNDMASQLKRLDMEISKSFLMHFIMTSLPAQFCPFKINYNMHKKKWKMSELISMCVQEEERLKSEQPDGVHIAITSPSKGKGKKFGKGRVQGNKSASITKTDKASSSGTNDDNLLTSSDMHMLHETKNFMYKNFDMKDLGEASYVIGIEIHQDRSHGILGLSQRAYVDKESAGARQNGTYSLCLSSRESHRFSAVIVRIREPRSTALIFASGKLVCTGAKTTENSIVAARKFARVVQKLGYPAKFKDSKIQNIVGSCDVNFTVTLESFAVSHWHLRKGR